nr:hypothetical protein [Tanacetum cinerariifolium]
MVERDDEIKLLGEINLELQSGTYKVLGEVNVELESGTKKLREKLSQEEDSEEDALKEFNSTLDNIKPVIVVQNNVQQEVDGEVVLYPPVHEDVAEEVIEMANDQAEALSDHKLVDECLDDKHVEERRPIKRIKVTQEEMVKDEKPKKS